MNTFELYEMYEAANRRAGIGTAIIHGETLTVEQIARLRAGAKAFHRAAMKQDIKALGRASSELSKATGNSKKPFGSSLLSERVEPIAKKLSKGHFAGVSAWFTIQKDTMDLLDAWVEAVIRG